MSSKIFNKITQKNHTKDIQRTQCFAIMVLSNKGAAFEMKKILLIEDDIEICEVITDYFNAKGTDVTSVHDGREALDVINAGIDMYDVLLLDIMLPGVDGFSLCRAVRRTSSIPLVFITARGREEDVLYGYELGCDDYITKPFSLAALYAKCTALTRRTANEPARELVCGKIRLDTRSLSCYTDGREIELPPKEFAILHYLMSNEDTVIDRDTLLDRLWGYDYCGSDRVVDNHIKKLRKALGSAGGQIKTVISKGYKIRSI